MSDKSQLNNIVIVGPTQLGPNSGGIAVHMQTLSTMAPFAHARFVDPKPRACGKLCLLTYLRRVIKVGKDIAQEQTSFLLVNISLTITGLIKLWLICRQIPESSQMKVHVFVHGGRLVGISNVVLKLTGLYLKKGLSSISKYWFLTREQELDFSILQLGIMTGRYRNYSASNKILPILCEAEDNNKLRVLFVGRLVHEKGVDLLLDSWRILKSDTRENIEIMIVGDGPFEDQLNATFSQSENIILAGRLTGSMLDDAYQWADVFVFPTFREGFPYVYIEAMRAGVPMLTTGVGALSELIEDGMNGWNFRMDDRSKTIETIANYLDWMYCHRNEVRKMGYSCHEVFEKDLTLKAGEQFYSTLVSPASNESK